MLIAATAAAALAWTARGGAALGRRVFALKGGVVPGLSASPTIEFVDVPPASP